MNFFGVTFRHGVHPPDSKSLTAASPVRRLPFPERIALPLRQHAGKPARCLVKKGDRVERGDTIAEADGFVSVPIHASAAGTVADIETAQRELRAQGWPWYRGDERRVLALIPGAPSRAAWVTFEFVEDALEPPLPSDAVAVAGSPAR